MSDLILTPNLEAPDDFYEALLSAHEERDEAAIHALNARLVLILANHIGRQSVLEQALLAAQRSRSEPGRF